MEDKLKGFNLKSSWTPPKRTLWRGNVTPTEELINAHLWGGGSGDEGSYNHMGHLWQTHESITAEKASV